MKLTLRIFTVADECREYFNGNLSEDDQDASVTVWDICGHEVYLSSQYMNGYKPWL